MPYRFLNKRYIKFIMCIRDKRNIRDYAREVDMTTSHLSNVIDHWERLGLIEKIRNGREIEVKFTEDGIKWKELLRNYEQFSKEIERRFI